MCINVRPNNWPIFFVKLTLVAGFSCGSEYFVTPDSLDLCQIIIIMYLFLILNNILLSRSNLNIYFVQ